MTLPGRTSLRKAIRECGGIITDVAERYQVTRQTVYRWVDRYSLRDEINDARQDVRNVAFDVIYDRLYNLYDDKAYEAARFVTLHLKPDGNLLPISPRAAAILRRLGIPTSDVASQFEMLIQQIADAEIE